MGKDMSPEYAEIVDVLVKHWQSTVFTTLIGLGTLTIFIWGVVYFLLKNQLSNKDSTIKQLEVVNSVLENSPQVAMELTEAFEKQQSAIENLTSEVQLLKDGKSDQRRVNTANNEVQASASDVRNYLVDFKSSPLFKVLAERLSSKNHAELVAQLSEFNEEGAGILSRANHANTDEEFNSVVDIDHKNWCERVRNFLEEKYSKAKSSRWQTLSPYTKEDYGKKDDYSNQRLTEIGLHVMKLREILDKELDKEVE